ncbi:MAG: AraC family transcriptional regulator [Lachnospiraceae bacterium]|nr:AraC family transcriptional regulator [Lachnospiraceae bacterium]
MNPAKKIMETYPFRESFSLGCLDIAPVHIRLEQLNPVIAAHRHSNVSYEIHYTAKGTGSVIISGQTFPVFPDLLYITGPGIIHTQYSDPADPVIEYCLYLNCVRRSREDPSGLSVFPDTAFWMGTDEGRIAPALTELLEENRHPQTGKQEMNEALLRRIVITLARMYQQDSVPPDHKHMEPPAVSWRMPMIEDAFFYHYADLTLEDLAASLHLSPRQTQRLLREYFGKTFSQKRTEARMAAACHYLEKTDLSVTAVSELLGFSSIEHFSAAFRRAMGCSAREYRTRHAKQ